MQSWKNILNKESFGFYVRLPKQFGGREIYKSWDEDNAVFGFPKSTNSFGRNFAHCQSQREYQILVSKAIAEILSGTCSKLVTSRIFKIDWKLNEAEFVIEQWKKIFPDAFVFVLNHAEFGLWIGASPELLIYRHGAKLHSVALAGSKAIGDDSPWGEKEKEEHEVVLRMIKDTFIENGVYNVTHEDTNVVNFRHVKHLCTPVKGEYKGDFGSLVKSLYPTPALSGWPKAKAIDWLSFNEPFERQLYGGVLNFSDGDEQWSMAILRCCHHTDNGWLGHVGGGVMYDSVPDLEWQETEWKRQAFIFANNAHFQ